MDSTGFCFRPLLRLDLQANFISCFHYVLFGMAGTRTENEAVQKRK